MYIILFARMERNLPTDETFVQFQEKRDYY